MLTPMSIICPLGGAQHSSHKPRQTDRQMGLILLPGPLTWEVIIFLMVAEYFHYTEWKINHLVILSSL